MSLSPLLFERADECVVVDCKRSHHMQLILDDCDTPSVTEEATM
jgi:hypothetical protein